MKSQYYGSSNLNSKQHSVSLVDAKMSPAVKVDDAKSASINADTNTMGSPTRKSRKFDDGVIDFIQVIDKLSNPNSFGK